jgi:hypothetical protein
MHAGRPTSLTRNLAISRLFRERLSPFLVDGLPQMLEGTRLRGVGGLCRIRFTLAPNQSQPGGNRASIAKQCGGVATHGTFQPR